MPVLDRPAPLPTPTTTSGGSLAPVGDDDPFASVAGGVEVVHVDQAPAASSAANGEPSQPTAPAEEQSAEGQDEEEDEEDDESDSDDVSARIGFVDHRVSSSDHCRALPPSRTLRSCLTRQQDAYSTSGK